jgi:hypothetical protein
VPEHVYHEAPAGHCWSGKTPYSAVSKLAGSRMLVGQPPPQTSEEEVERQQPTKEEPVLQAKKRPPDGQEKIDFGLCVFGMMEECQWDFQCRRGRLRGRRRGEERKLEIGERRNCVGKLHAME